MQDVASAGNTTTFTVPQIHVVGDQSCHACAGSADAQVTAWWNGSGFDLTEVLDDHSTGQVRHPQLADVQAVYDAVSSGGDATASAHMSADMVDSLDTTIGGPGNILTIRKAHFPPGGTVAFGYPDGPITSTEMHLPRDSIYSGTEASSGDVICPVTSGDPSPSWITLSGDYGRYQLWLVLEGRSDGAVEVKELGRNFS